MKQLARQFALAAHSGQQYGEHPYSFHLDQVAARLAPYGDFAQSIGYLHDIIEDTAVSQEEIAAVFGALAAECVALLTDEPGATRQERKRKTYAKLAGVAGPAEIALTVKTADRLANVAACIADRNLALLRTYQNEHAAFRKAAWRAGQCDPLWCELDGLLEQPVSEAWPP